MYLQNNLFQCYANHDLCMDQPVIEFEPAGLAIGRKYYTLIYKDLLEISCRDSHATEWK
jgi:hypothetical protein